MVTLREIRYAINFTFTEMNLQPPVNGQCADYVQFWDGGYENLEKTEFQLTEKLCAASLANLATREILGTKMKMSLLFHTDASLQSTGFKAEVERIYAPSSSSTSSAAARTGKKYLNIRERNETYKCEASRAFEFFCSAK